MYTWLDLQKMLPSVSKLMVEKTEAGKTFADKN